MGVVKRGDEIVGSVPRGHRSQGLLRQAEMASSDDLEPDQGRFDGEGAEDQASFQSACNLDDESLRFISEFARNQNAVHAYIRALVFNRSDAEDLMQNVSLTLWKKWNTFDPTTDFLRWACGVAFIEILRYRRKSAKDRVWFSEPLMELLAVDYQQHADTYSNRLDALATCIEKLNGDDRRLIEIRYRQGGSVSSLADELGKPLSTIYKMLLRIRQSLRRCIDSTMAAQSHVSYRKHT